MTMFWNPANLSDIGGTEVEANVNAVVPVVKVRLDPIPAFGFPGSEEGDIGKYALVPSLYAGHRLSDRVVVGAGINAPFGLATRYPDTSILNASGVAGTSKIFSLDFNPAASVDVADWLTLAAGVQVQYVKVRYTRQALGPLGISQLVGDDVAFGFTAGMKLRPARGTEIGIGYRSHVNHGLSGRLSTANAGDFEIRATGLDLPDIVTFGIRQKLSPRLRLMAGGEWQRWSRFDTVTVAGGPAPIPFRFDYNNGGFWSVGGEYDVTGNFTIRTGAGREISPIREEVRTFRLPEADGTWLSSGMSYSFNRRFKLDLAYTLLFSKEAPVRAAGAGSTVDANGPFSGRSRVRTHFFSVALTSRFD